MKIRGQRQAHIASKNLRQFADEIDRGEWNDVALIAENAEGCQVVFRADSLIKLAGPFFGLDKKGKPTKATLARWMRKAKEAK